MKKLLVTPDEEIDTKIQALLSNQADTVKTIWMQNNSVKQHDTHHFQPAGTLIDPWDIFSHSAEIYTHFVITIKASRELLLDDS